MKVLLIHPPYHTEKAEAVVPPLGIMYISAFLKQNGIKSKVIDCTPNNIGLNEIHGLLKNETPDVVGITVTTPQSETGYKIAKIAKRFNSNLPIIMGGPHINALFTDLLDVYKDVDVLIKGEGEQVMLALAREFEKDKPDLSKVKGICFRSLQGKIIINPPMDFIPDLDSLPFPDRDDIDIKKYRPSIKWYNRMPFTTMVTSRGCPFNCLFCDSHITWGRATRFRSAENVVAEIRHLVNDLGIKEIIFYDDTFTLNKKRVEAICDAIIKEKIDVTWGCMSRVDRIDQELVSKMKKAGCHIMSFGIESGSEVMLKKMKKHIIPQQAIDAIALLNKNKMDSAASFVFGIPGETKETMRETIDFVKKLNPTYAQFFRAVPFPGTELYDEVKKEGLLDNFKWETYSEVNNLPIIKLKTISEKDFNDLMKKAYKEFYLRPKKIMQYTLKMTSIPKLKGYLRASGTLIKIS